MHERGFGVKGCVRPLDGSLLAEYWAGELEPAREPHIEEHLMECGECSGRLESLVAMALGIRELARRGELRIVLTREFLARLERDGLRVRQYAPGAGGSVECTITPQDDVLAGRLAADLSGLTRVDAVFLDGAGNEWGRAEDIPFRAGLTDVVFNEPASRARQMGAAVMIVRLIAAGVEGPRTLGEYRFNHTPSSG